MPSQSVTLAAIRNAVATNCWALTRHARERAGKRRILDEALVRALVEGEILEDYPADPRGPSALVLGHTDDGRSVHAVCAFDPTGTLLVITVYVPEPPHWLDERTRVPG
ncbi:MAG: DUF4258 domain-containing protein [Chloroflexota bacterium]